DRRADYRSHVSAVHLLHDHRPEDNGAFEARTGVRRLSGRAGGDVPAAERSRLRAVLRAVPGRTRVTHRRRMVAITRKDFRSVRLQPDVRLTSGIPYVVSAFRRTGTCSAGL